MTRLGQLADLSHPQLFAEPGAPFSKAHRGRFSRRQACLGGEKLFLRPILTGIFAIGQACNAQALHLEEEVGDIDANVNRSGDQAFKFIATQDFQGKAGELRYQTFDQPGTANDITVVSGDINGDRVADFEIEIVGIVKPTSGDFLL